MMRIHISILPLWIAFVRAGLYLVSDTMNQRQIIMQISGLKTPMFLGNQDKQNQRRILEWVLLYPEHGYRLSSERTEDVSWLDWIMQERLVCSPIWVYL